MSENSSITKQTTTTVESFPVAEFPAPEELSVLGTTEKLGFRIAHWMNLGRWKRFWGFCQRHIGSLWIKICTYNLMNVFGIENIENSDVKRPLLLVANHRSFFDMYVVSSVIFRQTSRPIKLFFPVRGKFFYDNPVGWFVNLVMGWWSMYPPFFREAKEAKKREFDKYSLRRLISICETGEAHVIGFHPEGKRHQAETPYEFARAQPGVGKIVMDANPQVIPVFIAGLGNDLPKQILGNWTGGEKVRIWFGEELDLSEFQSERNSVRTHKKIADFVMEKIGELGEKDRKLFEKSD
ncbi:MAG: lysophospholipid acyltransferase family protein [Pyrinomonadaceae bacterium]